MDLERLMFQREQFPVVVTETQYRGRTAWQVQPVEIPPYHPLMALQGIPHAALPDVIRTVWEDTLIDLHEIALHQSTTQSILERLGEFHPAFHEKNGGLEVTDLPLVGQLYIDSHHIAPQASPCEEGISIAPELTSPIPTLRVPDVVTFSPELLQEYQMHFIPVPGRRRITTPLLWHRKNVGLYTSILYKNVVIALDNAVVQEKYRLL